jgi:hypothetical protein
MDTRAGRLLVAAAVAAAPAALAEPFGPPAGNALNPSGVNPASAGKWMFDEGMGTRSPSARTPTGQLYDIPVDPGAEVDPKEATRGGFVELGGLHTSGDDKSQGFRQYKDVQSGVYLNAFGLWITTPSSARYFELVGGGLGMQDSFVRMQAGRYNDWKVTAFYDGLQHVTTTSYRSLWTGTTGNHLALSTLTPGGSASAAATQANIQNALAATPESELETTRKKAGVRVDRKLTDAWSAYASLTHEKREGTRAFGAVFGGGGGGGNFELAEPIDYETRELAAGLQYHDGPTSFNLRALASFFRNGMDSFTFQNPLFVTLNGSSGLSPNTFTQGRHGSAPDNEHYNLKGEYARALPGFYRGNFTASLAAGTMRQDDALAAPTDLPLTGGTVAAGGVSLANAWNTTNALTRQSAGKRMDTFLVDMGLALRPTSALDAKAKVRYYETRNLSEYLSCNPLTGQFGRIMNDGSGLSLAGVNTTAGANPAGISANAYNTVGCDLAAARALNLAPAVGNVPIAAAPADYSQLNMSLAGDYRVGRASSLNAVVERETLQRDHRERDETSENRIKLGYVDRGLIEGMIRVSYENARRTGSEYRQDVYGQFQSSSLGPVPTANTVAMSTWLHAMDQFRTFDLADRKQNTLNGRIDYALHPNVDGAVSFQVKDAEYLAQYGRTGHQRANSATLDLNWQAGSSAVVYGYYSYQGASMAQKGVHPLSCVIGTSYYFYSDGRILTAATGGTPPATPAGTTLLATQAVTGGNWQGACGAASPTSPQFPESRRWEVESRDRNDVLGAGVKYDFGRVRVDATFSRVLGRTRVGYAYNAAALGLSATQASLAGTGLPDLTFAQSIFEANVLVPVSKTVTMRFLLRRESGKVEDWHYDGVAANPMPANNTLYLDAGPQPWKATVVGLLFQVRM